MHAEVIEQQAARAALVEQRAGLLEQRVHRHSLFHGAERVRLRRFQRGDGARRSGLLLRVSRGVVAVEALAVALRALAARLFLFLRLRHLVHAAEHLEGLVVEGVDAGRVDLDAGVEGARGLLEIGLAVLILAVAHNLADVVDERERPGVLGVDLVLARELDAVGVEVEHGVRGEHRALVRRGGRVAGDGRAPGEGGGARG